MLYPLSYEGRGPIDNLLTPVLGSGLSRTRYVVAIWS